MVDVDLVPCLDGLVAEVTHCTVTLCDLTYFFGALMVCGVVEDSFLFFSGRGVGSGISFGLNFSAMFRAPGVAPTEPAAHQAWGRKISHGFSMCRWGIGLGVIIC